MIIQPRPDRTCRGEARAAITGKGLTEDDVRAIRTDVRYLHDIAADYGISKAMVCHIQRRKRWRHVL